MQPRPSIFDSRNERELFHAVSGTWEPKHRLYPHIPFTNLIDLDPQMFDAAELSFLHKTTVDYVLTTAAGQPLLAIEFDGLGHGARRNGRYVQRVQSRRDPKRAWKLDLKCRAADEAGFSFAVVSYEEKEIIDPEANLVVAHGIIGGFLAHGYASRRMQELYEADRETIEALPPEDRDEYVQDYIMISASVEADLSFNPLCRRAGELERACWDAGMPVNGYTQSWPTDEPWPSGADDWDVKQRLSWYRARKRVGCTMGIRTPWGEVERTAWIRNIDLPGTTPLSLAGEVAHMLALQGALALARQHQKV